MRWSFSPSKGTIFFLLFSSNIETSCQQKKQSPDKLEMPCGKKFLRKKVPSPPPPKKKKISANISPAKIYSRVNLIYSDLILLHKNKVQKNCVCSITTRLFHSETKRIQWITGFTWYAYLSTVWKYVFLLHPDCTYLTRTKILSMLVAGNFLKIAKINSQRGKPMCPIVAKISFSETEKIPNPQK